MKSSQVTILLVDDDDVDAESLARGLRQAKIDNPLVRARDGIEALEILRGGKGRPPLKPPYLLLVDIRMPRLDGLGLIQAVRTDAKLSRTVIFVLTTSNDDRDKLAAYDANVAGYIVKGGTDGDFPTLTGLLEHYVRTVSPPPDAPSTF